MEQRNVSTFKDDFDEEKSESEGNSDDEEADATYMERDRKKKASPRVLAPPSSGSGKRTTMGLTLETDEQDDLSPKRPSKKRKRPPPVSDDVFAETDVVEEAAETRFPSSAL